MVALETVAIGMAGPDRQYAGLRQHCVLYTDATRALYRTRAELLAQTRRELKSAVLAEKRGGKLVGRLTYRRAGTCGHSGRGRFQGMLVTNVR